MAQGSSQSGEPKKTKRTTASRWGMGVGYLVFSDALEVNEGSGFEKGIANYAGVSLFADYILVVRRWVYGAVAGIATGKATAGGFAIVNYPDAGKRTWTLFYVEGSALYRVMPNVMLGLGLLAGNRSTDWKSSANPQISVEDLNKAIYAPELVLRWNASRRLTIGQALATPDFRGTTLWRWSAQYNF